MQNENVNETVEVNENNQYIEAIKQMKENSVDRSEYEKLKEENKKLLDSVINGGDAQQEFIEEKVDIKDLRNELFNSELSNLDYCEKALKLRKALIDSGEPDPFLPVGNQISPEENDIKIAQRVADVLQECVDYANGDSSIFTNELMRRTTDIKIR